MYLKNHTCMCMCIYIYTVYTKFRDRSIDRYEKWMSDWEASELEKTMCIHFKCRWCFKIATPGNHHGLMNPWSSLRIMDKWGWVKVTNAWSSSSVTTGWTNIDVEKPWLPKWKDLWMLGFPHLRPIFLQQMWLQIQNVEAFQNGSSSKVSLAKNVGRVETNGSLFLGQKSRGKSEIIRENDGKTYRKPWIFGVFGCPEEQCPVKTCSFCHVFLSKVLWI